MEGSKTGSSNFASHLDYSSGLINLEEALPDGIHGAGSPSPPTGLFGGAEVPNSAHTGSKLMN